MAAAAAEVIGLDLVEPAVELQVEAEMVVEMEQMLLLEQMD
jgi:hypothetical protein